MKKVADLFGPFGTMPLYLGHQRTQTPTTMTRTEIIEAAGSHYRKMAIAEHQTGHKAIVYYHESDTVEIEDNNNNGQDYRPECTTLLMVGCGSVSCNCDACMAGDEPADWAAGDVAELEAEYDRQVEEAINDAGIA